MTHNDIWLKPSLTENDIKKIIDRVGIKISKKGIRDIYYSLHTYLIGVHCEAEKNTPLPEMKKELSVLLDSLERTLKAFDNINPFITVSNTMEGLEWRKATNKLITKIKEKKINKNVGRNKQYVRVLLIHSLIEIFKNETHRPFIVEYDVDHYRDVERLEYDKDCMEFLRLIMDKIYPKLTADSLRKNIARALKIDK